MTKTLIFSFLLISCSIFSQDWNQLNDPPFLKHHSNGFGYGDKAYILEGTNTEDVSKEFWEYSASTDSWVQLDDFPGVGRSLAIGDDWNGKYYYGFGFGINGGLNDLWEFDPETMSFTELPSCPCVGRGHPSLIAHNDKIYIGAGSTNNGDVKDWWEYDMITQEWKQGPDIPGDDRHHTFHFAMDDYYYIGGGHIANWNRYEPETQTWTSISALPQGRVAGTQFNHDGFGYVLGGDDAGHRNVSDRESFMRYNPDEEMWEYLPSLPNGSRWAPSSFIINDEVYFFGGLSDSFDGDITMWKFDLSLVNCLPPSGLNAVNVSEEAAGLFWSSTRDGLSDTLRWRKKGAQVWNVIPDAEPVSTLDNLEPCQAYEFVVSTECSKLTTDSEVYSFTTDGCCTNPAIEITEIETTTAIVNWPTITAASEYTLRWKAKGAADWELMTERSNTMALTNLTGCTEYEIQIKSTCDIADVTFGESFFFLTRDCGICLDHSYCEIPLIEDEDLPFIKKVRINDYENISSGSSTYASFTFPDSEVLTIGASFDIAIEPEYSDDFFPLDLKVWIDYNANGDFESNEQVIDRFAVGEEYLVTLEVPTSASPGLTRMRVSYSIQDAPCIDDNFFFGEVEDYCVVLAETSNTINLENGKTNSLSVFPNPFYSDFSVQSDLDPTKTYQLKILDVVGNQVYTVHTYKLEDKVVFPEDLPAGVYILILENETRSLNHRIIKQN